MKTPRLREWREAMGETQATLGERSGVAEHTISRIEHGASLRPTTARKLADALGVAVADLMERPPVPLAEVPEEERAELPEAPPELPRTRLTDTAPEDFNRRLSNLESAKEAAELLEGVRKEEEALETLLAGASNPMPNRKLVRALIYRVAILDRWAKLADTRRDPASNRFKSVEEIGGEIAADQEWLKDLQAAEEKDRSAKGA